MARHLNFIWRSRRKLLLTSSAAICALGGAVDAALLTWVPAGGGDFNTPGNWNPAGPPGNADTGIFEQNAAGNITLSAAANPQSLSFRKTSGAATINTSGNTLTLGTTANLPSIVLGAAAGQINDVTLTGTFAATHTTGAGLLVIGGIAGSNGNTLTLTGAGTVFTSPSTGNIGTMGVAGSNNNTLNITGGAKLDMRGNVAIGLIGATPSTGNLLNVNNGSFILSGGNRGINLNNGAITLTNAYSDLGFLLANAAGNVTTLTFNSGQLYSRRTQIDNGRDFVIGDGGATTATFGPAYSTGTVTVGSATAPADLVLNSNGILAGGGAGTISILNAASKLRGLPGAKVMPSIIGQPSLTTDDRPTGTIALVGAWDNTNIEEILDVGDFPTAAMAATPFTPLDIITITGAFTHGGTVSFNMTGFVPPPTVSEFKVVGWTSEVGSNPSTNVRFLGGGPLPFRFQADGLYLTVPEPASAATFGVVMLRRRRR